jgi:hypothetical protein
VVNVDSGDHHLSLGNSARSTFHDVFLVAAPLAWSDCGSLASNASAGSKKAVARVTPRLITAAMLVLVIVLISLAIAAALR